MLRVSLSGRLGNNIIQLAHSIAVCNELNISQLHYDAVGWKDVGDNIAAYYRKNAIVLPSGLKLEFVDSGRRRDTGTILMGDDLYTHSVGLLINKGRRLGATKRDLAFALEYLLDHDEPGSQMGGVNTHHREHVVLHVRGNDVFGEGVPTASRIPTDYAQPPSSFYLLALEDIFAQIKSEPLVTLLSQDNLNPARQDIERFLISKGVEFNTRSPDMKTAARSVRRATYIIASRGTFVPGLRLGTRTKCCLYYFRDIELNHLAKIKNSHEEIRVVEDTLGKYTKRGDWMALREQVKMISAYPSSALKIRSST